LPGKAAVTTVAAVAFLHGFKVADGIDGVPFPLAPTPRWASFPAGTLQITRLNVGPEAIDFKAALKTARTATIRYSAFSIRPCRLGAAVGC
jgi:hypothetical protein